MRMAPNARPREPGRPRAKHAPQPRDGAPGRRCLGTPLHGGHARDKLGSRGIIVGAYDECGTQTMAEDALGIVGKHPVNLDGGITAIRQH